jgi:hypothetical protein
MPRQLVLPILLLTLLKPRTKISQNENKLAQALANAPTNKNV